MMLLRTKAIVVAVGALAIGVIGWLAVERALAQQSVLPARIMGDTVVIESKTRTHLVLATMRQGVTGPVDMAAAASLKLPSNAFERLIVYEFRPVATCEGGNCIPCEPNPITSCIDPPGGVGPRPAPRSSQQSNIFSAFVVPQ